MNFLLKINDERDSYFCASYAFAKGLDHQRRTLSSNFWGQIADYYSYVSSLTTHSHWMSAPLRKWEHGIGPRFHLIVNQLGGRGSPRFPTPIGERFSAVLLAAKNTYSKKLHFELFILLWLNPEMPEVILTSLVLWILTFLIINRMYLGCLSSR